MNSLAPPIADRDRRVLTPDLAHLPAEVSRLSAYQELAKPRIAVMVLLSMAVGFALATGAQWDLLALLHAGVGVLLAVVASSALNQYLERHTDARMARTRNRPLPSGRLTADEVLWFGLACGIVSVVYLAVLVNPLTAGLTLLTIASYAGVYTPLKRWTPVCTAVGALPGAMPPVLGWTAAGGSLDWSAFSLLAIVFVWQFPHFLAIAWMYRDQYEQAGLKMIPGRGRPGVVGSVSMAYALALIPVSLLPMQLDLAGSLYGLAALLLGLAYAWSAWRFFREESRDQAKRLLWTSLVYLPGVLAALTFDHFRLLN